MTGRPLRDIGEQPSVQVVRPRRPRPEGAAVHEPARELPVRAAADVVVVGGGPAGSAR